MCSQANCSYQKQIKILVVSYNNSFVISLNSLNLFNIGQKRGINYFA